MAEISTVLWDVGGVLLTNGWDPIERAAVLEQFGLNNGAFEQRHEIATDPWEKGLMTAEQYLLQTVFYESRAFTPAAFLQPICCRMARCESFRSLRHLRRWSW